MLSRLSRLALPAALIAAVLTPLTSTTGAAAPPDPGRQAHSKFAHPAKPAVPGRAVAAPDSVVVKFRASASASNRQKALSKHGGRAATSVSATYVKVTGGGAVSDLLKKLKAEPAVELASLNYVRKATATPNDELYVNNYQRYLGTVRMPETWNVTKTAGTQTIAVIDSGVDAGHPDLAGRIVGSYNVLAPGSAATDDNGHGTFVAGIAGATTNNVAGIAGAAWTTRLLAVKALDDEGFGTDADIATGIAWAASHGARVINLSLGGPGDGAVLRDAVAQANAKGVLVVAAAGNDGNDVVQYPAAYPEAFAVAATDIGGLLTDFSSTGDWVDIAAPGWNITSTAVRAFTPPGYDPYGFGGAGTSFSAPIVAGVAAMMRNRFTTYTPAQIMARMKTTARDAGPRGLDPYYGAGVLDAYNAVGGPWAPELPPGTRGANEPTDLPGQATAIAASTTGAISTEGDIDWYTVQSSAARNVTIRLTPPVYDANRSQNVDPILSAYNGNLQELGLIDSPEPGATEILQATFAAGTSYIAVRSYNGARDSRPYTLTVANGGTGSTDVGEQEWVTGVSPAETTAAISQSVSPVVTFRRTLNPATVTTSTVRLLHGKTGAVVPSTVTFNATARTATIDPTGTLQDNTPYRVSVGAVQDTGGDVFTGFSSTFRTVDTAPGSVTGFDATGGYGTAALRWTAPAVTDFDQIVVRRNAGTVGPPSPTTGTPVYAGFSASTTATGLAFGTTYTFRAWAKDRSGKFSAVPAETRLVGTKMLNAATPATIPFGGSVTRSGRLTRIDTGGAVTGVPVALQARAKNSTVWTVINRQTTTSTGAFSVVLKPTVSTYYAWRFDGSPDLMGNYGGYGLVEVRATITANLTKTSIPLGGYTGFYGYLRPQHSGQTVYLQRYAGGKWANTTTMKLNSTGNYSFAIKPTARGTYTYRVVWPADADHAIAISATKVFKVT